MDGECGNQKDRATLFRLQSFLVIKSGLYMLQQADFLHTNTFITIEDNYSAFSDPNILAPCLECLIFVINISET